MANKFKNKMINGLKVYYVTWGKGIRYSVGTQEDIVEMYLSDVRRGKKDELCKTFNMSNHALSCWIEDYNNGKMDVHKNNTFQKNRKQIHSAFVELLMERKDEVLSEAKDRAKDIQDDIDFVIIAEQRGYDVSEMVANRVKGL